MAMAPRAGAIRSCIDVQGADLAGAAKSHRCAHGVHNTGLAVVDAVLGVRSRGAEAAEYGG